MCATYTRLSLSTMIIDSQKLFFYILLTRVFFIVYLSFLKQKTNVCLLSGMLTSTLLMDRTNPCHSQKYKKLRRRQVTFFLYSTATRRVVPYINSIQVYFIFELPGSGKILYDYKQLDSSRMLFACCHSDSSILYSLFLFECLNEIEVDSI